MQYSSYIFLTLIAFIVSACTTCEEGEYNLLKEQNKKAECIYRAHESKNYLVEIPLHRVRGKYPWEENYVGSFPKITKEFFRCRGSAMNSAHVVVEPSKDPQRYPDCGGFEKHSLYLKEGKEFIYPILIDLLNYIQLKTGKRVVITSGYRCPEHNLYVDPSIANRSSKHMMGAEVDFYVAGLEYKPEMIIKLIMQYYKESSKYGEKKEFIEFERFKALDSKLTFDPWMNREILVKILMPHEGRNLDNRHNYPYLAIQVRYDFEAKERVFYNYNDAYRNYLRK